MSVFKGHLAWKEIDRKTQRLYEQGLKLLADHTLKDGSRVGSKKLKDFSRGFVDAVYAKLLVVEAKDPQGNLVTRTRRRFANAAMIAVGVPGMSVSALRKRSFPRLIRSQTWA